MTIPKKWYWKDLSEALHVSIEWLKGETDEYETDITDKKELLIRDAMGDILKQLPLDLNKTEDAFSKDLLLLMLKQYELFLDSFQFACKKLQRQYQRCGHCQSNGIRIER